MIKVKKLGRLMTLVMIALLVLSLTACGAQGVQNEEQTKDMDMSAENTSSDEPANAEEAAKMYDELMAQENEIFSRNTELWEKVFMAADKGMVMIEDGKNYGEFLLDTIEGAKDQFTDDELKLLKEEAGKISEIEEKLTMLEEKYPELCETSGGACGDSADMGEAVESDNMQMQKFPEFEGKDLDGNSVNSGDLFSKNAVTVVNFWFTSCNPCVEELDELDALNKEIADKGGELVGVNTFTLDGNEDSISEAKDVLTKKGVTYRNVYFDSDSDAGKFTENIYAYPTTYVIDRSGNIVGEPIVGAVTDPKHKEELLKLIDEAISQDS